MGKMDTKCYLTYFIKKNNCYDYENLILILFNDLSLGITN